MDALTEKILEGLKEATERACRETLEAGRSITIAKDNKVVRIYPDGSEEVLKELKPPVKVDRTKTYEVR